VKADDPTDQEVMMQVRAGDVEKLSVLFERHHARLYRYCLGLLGNRDAARDLVQEVFFRVLRYRETYRPDAPFAPWLYRVARNSCFEHLQKGRRERLLDPEVDMEQVDTAPLASEELSHRGELATLQAALSRLPADKRELLLLARSGSLTYDQIAAMFGCTVGALKVRVHRALQQLRETYTRLESEATP
jgi:RNA polymerase sigma factor (sigma-70 family)